MTEVKEQYQEELHDLFTKALSLGYNAKEAQAFCMKRLEHLVYCEDKSNPADSVKIRKMYAKDKIAGYTKVDKETQEGILWFLGIDTNYPVWEDVVIVAKGCKQSIEVMVCGQERTDKEWINKRMDGRKVASEEAQVASRRDKSLIQELNKISNSRMFE